MLGNSSEGGETETNNNDKFASAVFLTAVFIVVISICFEQGRHYVEHHASKVMQPMIQTLFAELTLLGFVGMLFFFAQRGKFLSILSADIFGEEEQGLLSEIFETVHYVLFLIMVVFLAQTLALVAYGRWSEKYWRFCEARLYLDADENETVTRRAQKLASASCFSRIRQKLVRFTAVDSLLYAVLRTQFITPVIREQNWKDLDKYQSDKLDKTFDYAEYLACCMGLTLAHIVEIPAKTWVILGLVFAGVWGVDVLMDDTLIAALFFEALGLVNLAIVGVFLFKVKRILKQLIPTRALHRASALVSEMKLPRDNLTTKLLQEEEPVPLRRVTTEWPERPVFEPPSPMEDDLRKLEGGDTGKAAIKYLGDDRKDYPAYQDLPEVPPSSSSCGCLNCLWASKRRHGLPQTPHRHDQLFWCQANGPEFLLFSIRLSLLFNAIQLSVVAYFASMSSLEHYWIYLPLAAFDMAKSALVLFANLRLITTTVIVSSTEMRKDVTVLAHVIRTVKIKRSFHFLRILGFLSKQSCLETLCKEVDARQKPVAVLYPNPRVYKQKETVIRQVFDVLDKDHSGSLEFTELSHLMQLLGLGSFEDSQVSALMRRLDSDGNGTVSFDELFTWIANVEASSPASSADCLIQQIFDIIDVDKTGTISVEKFQAIIKAVSGEDIPWSDLYWVIQQVDEDGDNMVNLREFAKLFEMCIA